jgi:hypothetical protein
MLSYFCVASCFSLLLFLGKAALFIICLTMCLPPGADVGTYKEKYKKKYYCFICTGAGAGVGTGAGVGELAPKVISKIMIWTSTTVTWNQPHQKT